MRIYTRAGDDGTTGLLFGGRVPKDASAIEVNGAVDEAQAAMGVARAQSPPGSELDRLLVELERQLYVLMAEVATAPANRHKLVDGQSLVTSAMVGDLEAWIDRLAERFEMPRQFVIPGANPCAAALDLARTVVRRAERVLASAPPLHEEGMAASFVGPYLNRLSDLLWTVARWQEGDAHLAARDAAPGGPRREEDTRNGDAGAGGGLAHA